MAWYNPTAPSLTRWGMSTPFGTCGLSIPKPLESIGKGGRHSAPAPICWITGGH